ncbi:MAG: MoaD/ThiS family protein [Betaproteobacteria bacterium]|nr:MoaD/ThiS family protein [Betaproteobacteria bacterium]
MKLTLLYFASLRERLECPMERVEMTVPTENVAGIVAQLRRRGGIWDEAFAPGRAWRISVNQRMGTLDSPVAEGDEIAFFPPVTGG